MAHKPNINLPESNQPEKKKTATSSLDSYSESKPLRRPSQINTSALDKPLRTPSDNAPADIDSQMLAETMAGGIGGVDKVRDILFGGHMRDYDKRFKRLEERFNQENMHFREDMFQRLKVLEERIDGEIDSIGEKTKVDRQERLSSLADLEHDIKIVKNEMSTRITQLDDQFSKDLKTIRQQTHNKIQELALQIRQQNDNLSSLFNQEITHLQEDKVNRSDLAAFFNEFATRLQRGYENTGGNYEDDDYEDTRDNDSF